MKSDVVMIKNDGEGFKEALSQAERVAAFKGLSHRDALHLRLLTEEMLCMMRALTGEREGEFWIDDSERVFSLHLAVNTIMNAEMRRKLLSVSSTGENSSVKGIMGKVRDLFERLLEPENGSMSADIAAGMALSYLDLDLGCAYPESPALWSLNTYRTAVKNDDEKWDELELSVVGKIADDVQVGISGQRVEMTITKSF